MTTTRLPRAAPGGRTVLRCLLGLLLVLAVPACSADERATSPEEVRELAGGTQAQEARKVAEDHLRTAVRAYDEDTPLVLGLTTVNDQCIGGAAKEWFFPTGDDRYRIRCSQNITAYYGADPKRIGDHLDAVLTAGDHDVSASPTGPIPFGHDDYRTRLVSYYRGHGPNPTGPDTPEPFHLSVAPQTLTWDTLRSSPKTLLAESGPCTENDPPVARCLREPASTTVADLRRRYGMVFRLEMSASDYHQVFKDGR
ncbi:hypothetical protein [Streptomyces sp. NBC_00887]|uniref:hypothetical protein n=1 Tax=Streptomyces sp. NBC_00887 TaxID=2975859 RepID=UPI00386B964F|nr:hypothetical protein OG844_16575 [Streptomyces sp. NBC_00887]